MGMDTSSDHAWEGKVLIWYEHYEYPFVSFFLVCVCVYCYNVLQLYIEIIADARL